MVQVQVHCPHIFPFSVTGASCHIAAKFNYYPKKKVEKLRLMCGIYSKLLCIIKLGALLYFFRKIFLEYYEEQFVNVSTSHVSISDYPVL